PLSVQARPSTGQDQYFPRRNEAAFFRFAADVLSPDVTETLYGGHEIIGQRPGKKRRIVNKVGLTPILCDAE
ncbi:MAG: hypothetical protein ACK4S4_16210, partial [Pyrinomonadaceae bacterium]